MGMDFMKKHLAFAGIAMGLAISASHAAISATEVVNLPTDAAYGGGDKIGSQLIAATYNAGGGPGIWIVADGGYRLYHNGALLAEDNQAGRVRFVPMTFLPGENAISVIGVNGKGAPGVMVQIDDLGTSYYSGAGWKAKNGISNNSWKNKGRDLSQWGGATTLSYANDKMPSGGALNGFAPNTQAKWIWSRSESDSTAILLFTFEIKAEGYGAATTGGDKGKIVIASDKESITKYLESNEALTILVPEGTYDFRQFRDAAAEANASRRTLCMRKCNSGDANKNNTYYRLNHSQQNSCTDLNDNCSVTPTGKVKRWDVEISARGNKSLIGMGRGANFRGSAINNLKGDNADNNIFRNLAVYDVNPFMLEGRGGLEAGGNKGNELQNIWFDHISYKWISDGMDLQHVKALTVSHIDYDGTNEYNCYRYDPFMHLVRNAQVTMHHMYWHNSSGRVPKVYSEDGGKVSPTVHVYNSYVESNYGHITNVMGTKATPAQLLYENNYIGLAQKTIAEKNQYGKVNMKNVKVKTAKSKNPYRNNGKDQSSAFSDNVFNPGYKYTLMDVNKIPSEVPKIAGVGGRFGKMPTYDQNAGLSNKAATVSMSAPAAGAKFDAGKTVTLTANAKDSDGSIKKVDFYVGNTLVGSANSAPYQIEAKDLEAGVHSAVAVVTDNSGLTQMSEFVTFTVKGAAVPESSSSAAESSSSVATSSSSSVILSEVEGSSSSLAEESSSSETTGIAASAFSVTDAQAAYYRIFDTQGRPLFVGYNKPAKMPAARVIVVEYTKAGIVSKRYIQTR